MPISIEARKLTDRIYEAYGTGSGIIFGIPPEHRDAVVGIVQSVLDFHDVV
ncbi:hypothetical protein LCGC14_2797500, partial [marine sediment metagenome]